MSQEGIKKYHEELEKFEKWDSINANKNTEDSSIKAYLNVYKYFKTLDI